jgi:hypothetical protein
VDEESGIFLVTECLSLLTFLASASRCREKPRAQGQLATQDLQMARRTIDLP